MSDKKTSASLSTLVVMIATFMSRILGFARNAVVGALFGQSWRADVLNAVFNIPFNLRKLMAEGALSSAFLPVFTKTLWEDPSGGRARDLTRALMSFQILVLVPLTVVAIVFADPIVAFLAPFKEPEKHALGVELFRWFINYLFLVSISAVMMAVLNSHQKFAVAAVSPILFSLSVMGSLMLLYPTWGIYAQIPGVLVGGVAQILMQYFSYRRLGYSLKPKWKFWTPDLKVILTKWGPALSISAIALINQQVSVALASTLSEGSVSALTNAVVFWQLPAGVLSASVITVFFARMSRQVAEKDWEGTSRTMTQGLELQALLLIPAGFLLFLFGEPIISLAFQRYQFLREDSVLAAQVLGALSWGLFPAGMFNFLQRFFFAKSDYRTPFWVCVAWSATDISVSLILMNTSLGVRGLAYGGAAGFIVGAVVLLIFTWKGLPKKQLVEFLFFIVRVILALVPLGFLVPWVNGLLGPWWHEGMNLSSMGLLMGLGLVALIVFYVCLLLLRIDPFKMLKNRGRA